MARALLPVAALTLVGAAPAASTPPATPAPDGSIGIQLLEAPVVRRDDSRAYRYIVDHLPPGTVIHRRMRVSSTSSRPLHVDVYPGAATIRRGSFKGLPGHARNELSDWMSVDRPRLDLPPNGNAEVKLTIRIPKHASSGERYAAVWAQSAGRGGPGMIKVVNRVGIRTYLSVGPGGEPRSDFRVERLTPGRTEDGMPRLSARVRNTGRRALDLSGTLWLKQHPGPISAGPFYAQMRTTLAPGDVAPLVVTVNERLPDGPWKARLTLVSGRVRHTVTATVTFPRAGVWGSSVFPDLASWPPALSWSLGLAPLLVGALGWRWMRSRRRRYY